MRFDYLPWLNQLREHAAAPMVETLVLVIVSMPLIFSLWMLYTGEHSKTLTGKQARIRLMEGKLLLTVSLVAALLMLTPWLPVLQTEPATFRSYVQEQTHVADLTCDGLSDRKVLDATTVLSFPCQCHTKGKWVQVKLTIEPDAHEAELNK